MEDCQAHNDPYVTRQSPSSDAALIALRILSREFQASNISNFMMEL